MQRFTMIVRFGWLLACILWAGATSHAVGQPVEARRHFETGNQRYEQGQYRQAVDAYQAALDTGYASGALYYNLGNALFRTGDLGRAILYYEKARRLLPNDPRLHHSLDIARSSTGIPAPPAPQGWTALAAGIDPALCFFLGFVLFVAGAGILSYRIWQRRSIPGWLGWIPLAAGLLLASLALGASWLRTLDRRAVVVAPEAPLHPRPMISAPRDTTLHNGVILSIQRRQPGWTEVRLSNGRIGWLRSEDLEDV